MQFCVYILIYPILWLISILPFSILYKISDGLYVLLFYVIQYRKKTVLENLHLVFPEKTPSEINRINKAFYRHLCDLFLEIIKTISISEKSLKKRFIIINPEALKHLESLNKSIILMYGHYASWEWTVVIEKYTTYNGVGIYKRLHNKYFDKLVRDIRSKFNTTLFHTKEAIHRIKNLEQSGTKSIFGFLSDQSPKPKENQYWTSFMGINVPCFTGAESISKKLDFSLAYLKINKVKRGHYEAEFITLTEHPRDYDNYALTDMFLKEVEKQIIAAPEYYLWTHKRWKHREL